MSSTQLETQLRQHRRSQNLNATPVPVEWKQLNKEKWEGEQALPYFNKKEWKISAEPIGGKKNVS